jgi:ribosomal protein S18 acetylase RimI-like enzyme
MRPIRMIRCATVSDIPRLMEIRGSVRENRLSDPARVTLADYNWHVAHAPIHVWEADGVIKGMSAGDPRDGSIWALFVDPRFEGRGIGQALISAATKSIAAAVCATRNLFRSFRRCHRRPKPGPIDRFTPPF